MLQAHELDAAVRRVLHEDPEAPQVHQRVFDSFPRARRVLRARAHRRSLQQRLDHDVPFELEALDACVQQEERDARDAVAEEREVRQRGELEEAGGDALEPVVLQVEAAQRAAVVEEGFFDVFDLVVREVQVPQPRQTPVSSEALVDSADQVVRQVQGLGCNRLLLRGSRAG